MIEAGETTLKVAGRLLSFSRAAYYKWLACPVSAREALDVEILAHAREIHKDDPTLGYRFIADEIKDMGYQVSERRVWKICHQGGVMSSILKKTRCGKGRPGPAVHDDLLQRHFGADSPNVAWVTDITEHHTKEGKLYLCAVKDLCSRRIVGYATGPCMKSSLAVRALVDAMVKRGNPSGVIVHSDRGSQFRSRKYVRALKLFKARGSMGRVGAAGDNAAMESFFALLQKCVLNQQTWETRAQLRARITHWIEKSYHRRRRQRALGKLTPIEYETIIGTAA